MAPRALVARKVELAPADAWLVIAIDDAAKLFVRAGDGNQKLAYRIFS